MSKITSLFGARLKELREEAELSMIELAREIGVSDAAICKWENGQAEPKIGYIVKLSEFFDCSIDYLIGKDDGAGERPPVAATSDERLDEQTKPRAAVTDEEEFILSKYSRLSPDRKKLLRETIAAWAETEQFEKEKKD